MAKKLREYQQKAVDTIVPLIGDQEKILISMPPGTGKLHTISHILYQYLKSEGRIYNEKIIFIVDRLDILSHTVETLIAVFEDNQIVTQDFDTIEKNSTILVTTIQKLCKNGDYYTRYSDDDFNLIIFFNCEKIGLGSERVRKLINYFNPFSIIGIDDVVKKSTLYLGEPVFEYTIQEAISDHVLVNASYAKIGSFLQVPGNKDFINAIVTLTKDPIDYAFLELKDFLPLANSIFKLTKNKKTVVICSVEYVASRLSTVINDNARNSLYSIPWTISSGNERNDILNEFETGKSLNLLTTTFNSLQGYELPSVEYVILLCEIASKETFYVIVSRFLKPFPEKDLLQILDYAENEDIFYQFQSEYYINSEKEIPLVKDIAPPLLTGQSFSNTLFTVRDKNDIEGVMGVKDIAEELSGIISRLSCEQGRMIGIFGEWGRGKTFLMDETWKILKETDNIQRIDFQAWKYQETPAIWAYLYEKFAAGFYNSAKNKLQRFWRRIRLNFKRLGWGEPTCFLLSFILIFTIRILIKPEIKLTFLIELLYIIPLSIVINLIIIYFSYRNSARELFRKYYSKPSFTNLLGIQAEVQKELKQLLNIWTEIEKNVKFLLFVDDIDRCSEERIIQIIDSLRVMIDDEELAKRLVIVTAIDERILKRAISYKYTFTKVDEEFINSKDLVSEYIDKLFIVALKLGDLTPNECDEYFMELSKADREKSDSTSETAQQDKNELQTQRNTGNKISSDEQPDTEAMSTTEETSSETIEEKNSGEKNTQNNNFFGITMEEALLLKTRINLFDKITPRQIRIFYFRYLIAKNLLIKQYTKKRRDNIWITPVYSSHFVELLIILSKNQDIEIISKEKKAVLTYKDDKYSIKLLGDIQIERLDYEILICILEIVIGY